MPMELSIHISPNVIKQLKALQRGGGNASQAAEHARKIIDQALEGICSPKQIGRLTRYGEARIPDCVKFDLVRGYRLIAVIGRQEISFLFVGSHDECDHWVKNNAGFEALADKKTTRVLQARSKTDEDKPACPMQEDEDEMEADEYDNLILRGLTDRDLREIFRGLCGKRA
ncbi:MAG: type II toxin-antitoxin system RelE/ParE family toxin [Syntrophobacteraceae bacterium]